MGKIALIQVAHSGAGHSPRADNPQFRVLRFCDSDAEADVSISVYTKRGVAGHIYKLETPGKIVIPMEYAKSQSLEEVQAIVGQVEGDFLKQREYIKEDFEITRALRKGGHTNEAVQQWAQYLDYYNSQGWMRRARARYNIHPDVAIAPGRHDVAIAESHAFRKDIPRDKIFTMQDIKKTLKVSEITTIPKTEEHDEIVPMAPEKLPEIPDRGIEYKPQIDQNATESQVAGFEDEEDVENGTSLTKVVRVKSQNHFVAGFLLSNDLNCDAVVYVHEVFEQLDEAESTARNVIGKKVEPLEVHVFDMCKWIDMVEVKWKSGCAGDTKSGTKHAYSDERIERALEKRRKDHFINREGTKMVKTEKELTVSHAVSQRLGLDEAQRKAITKNATQEDILNLLEIQDHEARHKAALEFV